MRIVRILARILAALAAIFLLIVAAWMIVVGPPVVLRVIQQGDSQIDHYRYWPARMLEASPEPFRFSEDPAAADFADRAAPDGSDLDSLLEANDTLALLVLKDDRLVMEHYYQGHGPGSISMSFSMAKSVTSMLVGAAIDDGYIQSVDQPVTDFVPELAGRGFEPVTIAHLLTMTSGSSYIENDNPFGVHVILNYTSALEPMILDFRVQDPPGTVWRYKSGDTALLGLILTRALAPKTISDYTQERLWSPLDMEYDGMWSLDHEGDGLERTWCCLSASARDFLKLGRLYLQEGQWEGRPVISADWVHASTQVGRIPTDAWDDDFRRAGVWNYGYNWWLVSEEEGSYLAIGKDGQYLYVNPARNAVILRLGWSQGSMPLSQWLELFERLSFSET